MGALDLALPLVWVVGVYGMVNYCVSTLGGGWVIFFILFHYFGLCFSCLNFDFWCDLALEDVCNMLVANGDAGAEFFSALIRSVDAWVAAFEDEIPGIVVLSEKKEDCVYNTLCDCVGNGGFITPVGINCRSYVPHFYSILDPCVLSIGIFMEYYLGDWWFKKCFLEVKIALHNSVR